MRHNVLKGKNLLLINTGSTHKRHVLKRLKQLELNIIALNKEKNWAQPYVDHWIITDNTNHQMALNALDQFIKDNPEIKIDGVLTFWEDDVLLTSKIVDKYRFVGISQDIAQRARNKFNFRKFCSDNGLPTPRFKAVRTMEDLEEINKTFQYPLVIKPAFGSASNYVVKVENKAELENTFNYIKNNISASVETALLDGLDIFIEEYIEGDEVDIDLLLQNGKVKFACVSDNFDKTFDEFFLDKGQSAPSSLSAEVQQELISVAEDTLEKLGIFNGCIHYEAKATKNGPMPIEVNLRMGGDYVWSYIKDAWDVDLIENAVKIAVGEMIKFPKEMEPKKYVIGWDLHPEESGILAELDIPEEFEQLPFLEDDTWYKDIGEPVLVPPEGTETIGWLTVSGENFLDAQENLQKALELIKYNVVKFDTESSLGKTVRKSRFESAKMNQQFLIKAAKLEKLRALDKNSLKKLRLAVIGNFSTINGNPIDNELSVTVTKVSETLKEAGYEIDVYNVNDFNNFLKSFDPKKTDLVINLTKKINNSTLLGAQLPTLLEAWDVPYTGSSTISNLLCKDKIKFKKILKFHEIPTPDWDYMYDLSDELDEDLEFPLIVKPAHYDNSVGIDNSSIVYDHKSLMEQAKMIIEKLKSPVLIEEYIEGDEYRVSIIGNNDRDIQILPLSRTIFTQLPQGYPHIYTYDAKWSDNKVYGKLLKQYPVKNINKKLETLLSEVALDVFNIFKCRDHGVVEFRVDENNNPHVLEAGSNPSLRPNGELSKVSQIAEYSYLELIEEIIKAAVSRYQQDEHYRFVN